MGLKKGSQADCPASNPKMTPQKWFFRNTGCPTVRVNSYTPLNFDIAQRITKPFKSCHHESLRIFLVYKTHWCVLLAPHKWWLKIKSIFRYLLQRVSGWAKNKKQKLRGVHVQVLCGMKDVMIKENLSVIKPNFREINFR